MITAMKGDLMKVTVVCVYGNREGSEPRQKRQQDYEDNRGHVEIQRLYVYPINLEVYHNR